MFKIFCILIFLYVMIRSTNSIAPGNIAPGKLPRYAAHKIFDAVGGGDQFNTEVYFAVANASARRNGIPASFVELKVGGGGIVSKICFDDGVCWADKMLQRDDQRGEYGMLAMLAVKKCCPNIPVPKIMGWCQRKLDHYFTEWIEGKTLSEWVLDKDPYSTIVKIPEKVVISLAEFVYNLTTCPIPREGSKKLFR
jgi:hypothetical protein